MIVFNKIKYKNFLSTGNTFTEIDLQNNKTTLIIGKNGAGKSTLLDALSFVLYGKPFRKINKPQLVNTTNKKDLVVEIDFYITESKKNYRIVRGIKPNRFEIYCDSELMRQDSKILDYQANLEKTILKMNHKSFSQIVILGSSTFVPFMQLSAQNRREVIEDLLDLQVFSIMNSILKLKLSTNKEEITDYKHRINLEKEKLKLSKSHIAEIEEIRKSFIQEKKNEALKMMSEIQDIKSDIRKLLDGLGDSLSDEITKKSTILNQHTTHILNLRSSIRGHEDNIKFYEENDICPTCRQEIDDPIKDENIQDDKKSIEALEKAIEENKEKSSELEDEIKDLKDSQSRYDSIVEDIKSKKAKISFLKNSVIGIKNEIADSKKKSEDIKSQEENKDISVIEEEIKTLSKELKSKISERDILSTAALLLKDGGIKTRIIKQYIPIMNKLINKYLGEMDFPCEFELDENFQETIKSRFRDEFSYQSFSEGEKLRINLAILFSWRAISKMRNSSSTNLLIFDEIGDSSLDGNGFDDFMKIINQFADNSNIFLISHKVDTLSDNFENVIEFEKSKGFSYIKEK